MKKIKKFQNKLKRWKKIIEKRAGDYGLDFFPVNFEVLDYDQILEVAAKGGFPVRYSHWRFAEEYKRLRDSYAYGLSKIYEMVVNTDPCHAYLLECNPITDQKLVMAHVYAHCDFFKNNVYFKDTNRKMLDEMANHAAIIGRFIDKHGLEEVEKFIEICLSMDDLIDPIFGNGRKLKKRNGADEENPPEVKKIKSKDYMDDYINPKEHIEAQRTKLKMDQEKKSAIEKGLQIPAEPERDVLLFLINNAPLADWQIEIMSIIREEAYYFLPQGQTQILNEGWAAYWHTLMMTEDPARRKGKGRMPILKCHEIIDYADHHSGTMSSPGLNPYKIGIEIFKDIEDRWNKGKFGKEYNECEDLEEKKNWNKNLGLGRKKIFEVRKHYNDVNFLDEFLTPELCVKLKFFTTEHDDYYHVWRIASRDFAKVKKQIIFALHNHGQPFIEVTDANFRNKGELYLQHKHELDLGPQYTIDMLKNMFQVWKRPVHLETKESGKKRVWVTYDGKSVKIKG